MQLILEKADPSKLNILKLNKYIPESTFILSPLKIL